MTPFDGSRAPDDLRERELRDTEVLGVALHEQRLRRGNGEHPIARPCVPLRGTPKQLGTLLDAVGQQRDDEVFLGPEVLVERAGGVVALFGEPGHLQLEQPFLADQLPGLVDEKLFPLGNFALTTFFGAHWNLPASANFERIQKAINRHFSNDPSVGCPGWIATLWPQLDAMRLDAGGRGGDRVRWRSSRGSVPASIKILGMASRPYAALREAACGAVPGSAFGDRRYLPYGAGRRARSRRPGPRRESLGSSARPSTRCCAACTASSSSCSTSRAAGAATSPCAARSAAAASTRCCTCTRRRARTS